MIVGVVSRGGRGWRSEQATTVRKNEKIASGGGEGGVGNRAREGKRQVVVVAAITGTSTVVAGETTLNSLSRE